MKPKQYKTKKSKTVVREPEAEYLVKKHGEVKQSDFDKVVTKMVKSPPMPKQS